MDDRRPPPRPCGDCKPEPGKEPVLIAPERGWLDQSGMVKLHGWVYECRICGARRTDPEPK